jgi:hypothetical protein
VSVNCEDHVLGLWVGGGVTPAALALIAAGLDYVAQNQKPGAVRTELQNIANACHAQLTKRPPTDPNEDLL